jgi:alpha-glucosidase
MKKAFFITSIFILFVLNLFSQESYKMGDLKLVVQSKQPLILDLLKKDQVLIKNLKPAILLSEEMRYLEYHLKPAFIKTDTFLYFNDPLPTKYSVLKEDYLKLNLNISMDLSLEILMNHHSFNYRWLIDFPNEIEVLEEKMEFELQSKDRAYFPKEDQMISHFERWYLEQEVDSIAEGDFCSLPLLFQKQNGNKIWISEADVYGYPNMFIEKSIENKFEAIFPKYVIETKAAERGADRNQIITKEADFICKTQGKRTCPWRVFVITDDDHELLKNTTVYQLSRDNKDEDFSWVKPGKVAWDWWNANNITGVDFKSGINNETYKYYIDFVAEYDLEYIILDEGWSKSTTNIVECQPEINVQELVKYGEERNVGIILWTLWGPLNEKMEEVLNLYESWGVKGIKVDFMQRADQSMVEFYERIAREAAKRKLLVDFHGAFKPAGLRRAYPNVVNYEGLKGQENVKWSDMMTPQHNLTLPFIRMVAGPMDYTPGAMNNAHKKNFAIRWDRPMSMGTRCHQVAMYVVYESPLQMLCDNPSNYYKEKESTQFISQIPTTWDETIVFEAKVADHLLMARRNGEEWFIGGMTVEAQEFEIDLSFLEEGAYEIQIMQDGINSDKNAEDYRYSISEVSQSDKLKVRMHWGGGYAAVIKKK